MKKTTPLSEILVPNSSAQTNRVKHRLFREGVLKKLCAECGLGPEWNGNPLTLQLDHINGDSRDHRLENLRVVCPNCHSQTLTYAGRNKTPPTQNYCGCGKRILAGSKRCKSCSMTYRHGIEWPSDEYLQQLVWQKPLWKIARDIGVKSVTVGNRCRKRGIPLPSHGHWAKKKN
jgi:hypothetical protein